jgi:hypothetical protein
MSLKLKQENSLLERLGIKYFQRLEYSNDAKDETLLENIPSDKILDAISDVIVKNSTIIAFLIGAIVTIPLVFFEVAYYDKISFFEYIFQFGLLSLISLIVELLLLYWLTLQSIYALLHLIGKYPNRDKSIPKAYMIDRVLIRAALELEEPILEYMGVDPRKKLSKAELFFMAFLYKLKVALSSFVAKKVLKAVLPRLGARTAVMPFVGVFIVAFWDAYVLNRSIKDARLRLFGHYFSRYLIDNIVIKKINNPESQIDIEGAVRAIASIMALSKSNHPNNVILLVMLDNYIDSSREIKEPDSLDEYKRYLAKLDEQDQHYLKVLSVITAVLDSKITKEEKEALLSICQDKKGYYLKLLKKMRELLNKGRIHELTKIVTDEFGQ